MSTRELIAMELEVLPEPLQQEVYDFVRFLRLKSEDVRRNIAHHFSHILLRPSLGA